jgi:PiT family inorganic phosphate transporter
LISALTYGMALFLIALVSGNNLTACSGSIIAGRIVGKRAGILLTIAGYSLGFLLQGSLLSTGINAILPVRSDQSILLALSIATLIFLIAHRFRVPQSLSITLSMTALGISTALGLAVDWGFIAYMITFWIAAAFLCTIFAFATMRATRGFMSKVRIWKALSSVKMLLILISFFTAFTLGANTIGFLYVSLPGRVSEFMVIAAIIFGSFVFSAGEIKRVGSDILPLRYLNALVSQSISVLLVEAATLSSVPLSNTQTFIASLYGSAVSYRTRIIRKRPAETILFTWIVTSLVSFSAGFLLTKVLL